MAEREKIQHEGIVISLSTQTLEVAISSHSACADCHVKGNCGMAEVKQKIITVDRPFQKEIKVGDKVMVYANLSNAFYSVWLAYILPSILIIVSIFFFQWTGYHELTSAIIALILLVLYFFILYLFRNKIHKKIKFSIEYIGNY